MIATTGSRRYRIRLMNHSGVIHLSVELSLLLNHFKLSGTLSPITATMIEVLEPIDPERTICE
jgi:hypothetical protein